MDLLCWQQPGHVAYDGVPLSTSPHEHSVGCMLMPPCVSSGFAVLAPSPTNR